MSTPEDVDAIMLKRIKEKYPDAHVEIDADKQVARFKLHANDPGIPFDYSPLYRPQEDE